MKVDAGTLFAENSADQSMSELLVERLDDSNELWANGDPESGGIVHVEAPAEGKMIRVSVTGRSLVYVGHGGKIVIDNR